MKDSITYMFKMRNPGNINESYESNDYRKKLSTIIAIVLALRTEFDDGEELESQNGKFKEFEDIDAFVDYLDNSKLKELEPNLQKFVDYCVTSVSAVDTKVIALQRRQGVGAMQGVDIIHYLKQDPSVNLSNWDLKWAILSAVAACLSYYMFFTVKSTNQQSLCANPCDKNVIKHACDNYNLTFMASLAFAAIAHIKYMSYNKHLQNPGIISTKENFLSWVTQSAPVLDKYSVPVLKLRS